jgi:hypothetical protein
MCRAGQPRGHSGADFAPRLPFPLLVYRGLRELDPPDPAEVHFRLATLLHQTGGPAAKRHVLQAHEEAPRRRAALKLLLGMDSESPRPQTSAPPAIAETKP